MNDSNKPSSPLNSEETSQLREMALNRLDSVGLLVYDQVSGLPELERLEYALKVQDQHGRAKLKVIERATREMNEKGMKSYLDRVRYLNLALGQDPSLQLPHEES